MKIKNIADFKYGFAVVTREDNLMNYIDSNGNVLYPDMWFEWADEFTQDEYALVQRCHDYAWNFIDSKGKILSPNMWFAGVGRFYDGVAYVYKNLNTWNYINRQGEIISPNKWFEWADDFYFGYGEIQANNSKLNYIDNKGNILSPNLWFDTMDFFNQQPIGVIDGQTYFFDKSNKPHKFLLL